MQFIAMMALALAVQDVGTVSPGGMEAIGPKQDDPRAMCEPGGPGHAGMLSQGRVRLSTSSGIKPTPGGSEAIGPKQDDPRAPGVLARPGDDNDPKASGGQGGGLAIGPKQDDPRSPGLLAIGPKQDDPRAPGVQARPGDDEDPQALAMAGKCGAKAR
jgi:hypothetical protein